MNDFVEREVSKAAQTSFASKEAEQAIIGCFIAKPDEKYRLSEVEPDDFFFTRHRVVFQAMRNAAANNLEIDLVTIDQEISKIDPNDPEGRYPSLLIECSRKAISAWNLSSYMQIVRELSARRRAIATIQDLQVQIKDPKAELEMVLDRMSAISSEITVGKHTWESIGDVLLNTYSNVERRAKGELTSIPTGIMGLDAYIGGLYGGELTVVGARPAVGKSLFAMNTALAAARKGYHVGFCSLEMGDTQFGQRIFSHEGRIDGMKLRRADIEDSEWSLLAETMIEASTLPIDFVFSIRTIEELRQEVQHQMHGTGKPFDLLIVDYLQLMETQKRFDADHLRVGYISKRLKAMAMDFNIPVMALAQVKRFAGGGRSRVPTLEDLKDSGAIEQDADGVIFLHNPDDSTDESIHPNDRAMFENYRANGYTYQVIAIGKQRQGMAGKTAALLDKKTLRYIEIDRRHDSQ